MAAQPGRSFLLKVGDGASPPAYTTIGGMRTTSFKFNNGEIDATDKDSAGWRELIEGGVRSMEVSADGIFKDTAAEETLRADAFAGRINDYRIVAGNGDSFEGLFQIASYARGGKHEGEETFTVSLRSAGPVLVTLA